LLRGNAQPGNRKPKEMPIDGGQNEPRGAASDPAWFLLLEEHVAYFFLSSTIS
jgi:hypothetical protein